MAKPLTASERAQRAARERGSLSPEQQFLAVRKSYVPEGGWTHENFVGQRRRDLVRDVVNVHRFMKAEGIRLTTESVSKVLRDQIERVAARGEVIAARLYGLRKSAGSKAETTIEVASHASLWEQAIEQEMRLAGIEVETAIRQPHQSVTESTYQQVGVLLGGGHPTQGQLNALTRRVNEIAVQVTGVNATTEQRIRDTISGALREGDTVFEVAERLRDRVPQIGTNRAATIARTEMGRAADNGTKLAMVHSDVVSHFSVIGCEAIERNGPHFDGVPTCNIQNVPIENEYDIEFHPNHTGAIVMSGFKRDDGTSPDLPLQAGGSYSR